MVMWNFYRLLGCIVLLVTFSSAYAKVEIVPTLLTTYSWTDNLSLAIDALQEEEMVTEIRPEVTLNLESRRHRGTLNTSFQHFTYQRRDETRELQQYRARTNSMLVTDMLYLNFSADRSQRAASEQGVVAVNNVALISNRTDVSSFNVNPYLLKRWSPYWKSTIDYSYREINDESSATNNSQTQELTGMLSYGRGGEPLSMDLSYRGVRVGVERNLRPTELNEIRLDTHYQMSSILALLLNAGYEEDQYNRATTEKTQGGFGEVGVELLPTRKVSVSGTVGERYFGNTAFLQLLYRYNRETGVEIGYRKDITQTAVESTSSELQLGVGGQFDELNNTFLTTEVNKTRRTNIRFYYQRAKSRGELSGYYVIRDFQLSLNREVVDFIAATWSWSVTARSTVDIDFSIRGREIDNQVGEDRLQYARLKFQTIPRKNVSIGGEYGVTKRSGSAFQNYRQQQLGVFVNLSF